MKVEVKIIDRFKNLFCNTEFILNIRRREKRIPKNQFSRNCAHI